MSRIEESRSQFLHWARWKIAGGRVEQDPRAAEVDDLISGMPVPLKETLVEVYLQGRSERPGPGCPGNIVSRRLGQADRLLRDQLSQNRMALRLQAIARAMSGEPIISDGMAIAEDGTHRNESALSDPPKPLNQQAIAIPRASSGIGLATTLSNARQGPQLVLVVPSADTWEKVVAALSEQGAQPQREGRRRRLA